ncbi:pentapeptide repeat-containing protein [Streptomyces sp. NPDC051310]|uniref:pentapeptide repeat-containing protein n=1 Tax=Streptomyces sp. NPDC051310 TaxID=3365649 RepID=UPI0037A399AC
MTALPPRRSGRFARRRTRTTPRRAAAPIGSRLPGRRRRTPAPVSAAARQSAVSAPNRWTRIQQAAGTLAALGALAVIVLTWLSVQQVEGEHALTREGQVTDRYNAAVTNIGEASWKCVWAASTPCSASWWTPPPRDQPSIVNILSTYIRNHAKKPKQAADASNSEPASDIQAALTALGSREPAHDGTASVDLRGAYLPGADLADADLRGAILNGADLTDAFLPHVNLNGEDLTRADLTGANMTGVTGP